MSKREIVEIRLGRKSDGSIARDAAFMVFADDPDRAAKGRDYTRKTWEWAPTHLLGRNMRCVAETDVEPARCISRITGSTLTACWSAARCNVSC